MQKISVMFIEGSAQLAIKTIFRMKNEKSMDLKHKRKIGNFNIDLRSLHQSYSRGYSSKKFAVIQKQIPVFLPSITGFQRLVQSNEEELDD